MDMNKITKIMDEYFKTVTPEQFEKDLIEAGIENCPDKPNCFGTYESDVGSCVDCSYENEDIFIACLEEKYKQQSQE